MATKPKYALVLRTYGGQEATRVRSGTRFTIDNPELGAQEKLTNISFARYTQLLGSRIVKPWAPGDPKPTAEDFRARPAGALAKVEGDSRPPVNAQAVRATARQRTGGRQPLAKSESPDAPRRISAPSGGQIGAGERQSSSEPGLVQETATLRQRGVRRGSDTSPLTTPGDSRPGPNTSTPATPRGGAPITTSSGKATPDSEEVL